MEVEEMMQRRVSFFWGDAWGQEGGLGLVCTILDC